MCRRGNRLRIWVEFCLGKRAAVFEVTLEEGSMIRLHCNVDFEYQLRICSEIEKKKTHRKS